MTEVAKYTAETAVPFKFDDPVRHEIAMREVAETLVFTSEEGQRFTGIHVNRDFVEGGNPPPSKA